MHYDADLRRYCKSQAKSAVHNLFWPSMLSSLICIIPITLAAFCYSFDPKETMDLGEIFSSWSISFLISLLIDVFILSPIIMGAFNYFIKCIKHSNSGEKPSIFELFYCFESIDTYFMSVKVALVIFIYTMLWCFLLSGVMIATLSLTFIHPDFLILSYIITIPFSIFISTKISSYYAAYALLAENPEISARNAVTQSAFMFKGHLWELFVFEISFIGWMILSILTFGIASIYLFAYFTTSFICYVNVLKPQPQKQPSDEDFSL